MMAWTNYHSHTHYCDGKHAPEEFVEAAIRAGIASYGFSSHAPVPYACPWAMQPNDLPSYHAEISRLKAKYRDQIQLYCSLETDFIPGVRSQDRGNLGTIDFDYRLGAVHFVEEFRDGRPWEIDGTSQHFAEGIKTLFKGNAQRAVSRYYELIRWMVMLESPDVVAHLDKIKMNNDQNRWFKESDEWYRKEVEKTLKVIANMGSIVEVNTRGLYKGKTLDLYPSTSILERMYALGIPVTLSSDAHTVQEVIAGFEVASRILRKIGYTHVWILFKGKWMDAPLTENGIEWPEPAVYHEKLAMG